MFRPFVADPEKNTIWDLTYEEAIEQSGSSQSIKVVPDNKENDCNPLNATIIGSDDMSRLDITTPVGRIEANSKVEENTNIDMNCNVEDMELTVDIDFNAQCIIVNDRNEDRCGDMEFTVPINNLGIISSKNENKQEISLVDMEFTTAIGVVIPNINKSIVENVDMSLDATSDDTEKLINYNLSGVKESDFSKVIAGDLEASFPNLPAMPLRGINSTSFVQSLPSEIRSCGNSQDVSDMSLTSIISSTQNLIYNNIGNEDRIISEIIVRSATTIEESHEDHSAVIPFQDAEITKQVRLLRLFLL